MIDSHISPSLESWVIITTATHSNTEFHIPAYIPNRSELYDTVRKTYQQIMKWKNTCVCLNQWKHVWHELNEFPWRLSLHTHFMLDKLIWFSRSQSIHLSSETQEKRPFLCPLSHSVAFQLRRYWAHHNMCGYLSKYSLWNTISYRDRSIWKSSKSF